MFATVTAVEAVMVDEMHCCIISTMPKVLLGVFTVISVFNLCPLSSILSIERGILYSCDLYQGQTKFKWVGYGTCVNISVH